MELVLGSGVEFDVFPRRGVVRNSTLPPCEVDFRVVGVATRFRTEAARLSRAKHERLANLFFNPCLTLATRCLLLPNSLFLFVITQVSLIKKLIWLF